MSKRAILISILGLFAAAAGTAWEFEHAAGANFAYYLDYHKGVDSESASFVPPNYNPLLFENSPAWLGGIYGGSLSGDETRKLGSGWGSIELEMFYRFQAKTPLMAGDGFLIKDNHIQFIIKPIISPISFHVETEVRWQPVAFLKILGGLSGGTGWRLGFMNIDGLVLNNSDSIANTPRSGYAGFYFVGATLQFDLNALVPGRYTHVVFSATGKFRYMHYSEAGPLEAWYWRADSGRNFNGWEYRGDYAVGWQPPWKVNFIGMFFEHRFWLSPEIRSLAPMKANFNGVEEDGLPAQEAWGSDFQSWRFGPVVNLALNENHGLTIFLQFHNGIEVTEATAYSRWFRRWDATGNTFIYFERLALAYTWKL